MLAIPFPLLYFLGVSSYLYKLHTVSQLVEEILKHRSLYYHGQPEITDRCYDYLEKQLEKLDPGHPVLKRVGTTTPIKGEQKVAHHLPMLSLQKTYTHADLFKWIDHQPVMGSAKIDGNSLSLLYEHGKFISGRTRGDGQTGEEVTHKITWVNNFVKDLKQDLSCEIRGELYCQKSRFFSLREQMRILRLPPPSNQRNIVAGLLTRKGLDSLCRFFDFLAFEILDHIDLPFQKEEEKISWLEKRGFSIPYTRRLNGNKEVSSYLDEVQKRIKNHNIPYDGAVFVLNSIKEQKSQGFTSHHPRFKLAFKWQGETAETKISAIHWTTSRLGIVTPVAAIEPVVLSGASIRNVTLHNAQHVATFQLKPGDIIQIIRSGEVIPKFLRIHTSAPGFYVWPTHCKYCNTHLEFDQIRLFCPNKKFCPAQKAGLMLNWVRSVQIDYLSEKRLANIIELSLAETPDQLYSLSREDLLKLPLTKEKMADKLWRQIQESKTPPILRFFQGVGIAGIGKVLWERLLKHHATIDLILKLSPEEIVKTDGFAEKTAKALVYGLRERLNLIKNLIHAGVTPISKTTSTVSTHFLSGKIFAITGTFSESRQIIIAKLKRLGASIEHHVRKSTHALIIANKDSQSNKTRQARKYATPLWDEEELKKQISSTLSDG